MLLTRGPSSRGARLKGRAGSIAAGAIAGLLVLILVAPAALLGWRANLGHLDQFLQHMVLDSSLAREAAITKTNHSTVAATWRLANWIVGRRGATEQGPTWEDERSWRLANLAAASLLLGALGLAVFVLARNPDPLDYALSFCLACVASVLLAPIAWTHTYLLAFPGFLVVPLWMYSHRRERFAAILAMTSSSVLVLAFLSSPLSATGLPGVAMTLWYLVVTFTVIRLALDDRYRADGSRRTAGALTGWFHYQTEREATGDGLSQI